MRFYQKTRKLIPEKLNIFLSVSVFVLSLTLLWMGSIISITWIQVLLGFVYAHILLTAYAIIHEASHENLHRNKSINYFLGFLSALFFPTSLSLVCLTHTKHHLCNRTDHEMFDYYYKTDNLFLKYGQWYSLLFGLFWVLAFFGNLILCLFPYIWKLRIFQNTKSAQRMLEEMKPSDIRKIRLEVLFIVCFWTFLFLYTPINLELTLFYSLGFGFNWSTRQYVSHAFSVRDVYEGAWNLKTNFIQEKLLLNGNWDYEHHSRPELPWILLPASGKKRGYNKNYLLHYFSLWLGPRKNRENPPIPIRLEEYLKRDSRHHKPTKYIGDMVLVGQNHRKANTN